MSRKRDGGHGALSAEVPDLHAEVVGRGGEQVRGGRVEADYVDLVRMSVERTRRLVCRLL